MPGLLRKSARLALAATSIWYQRAVVVVFWLVAIFFAGNLANLKLDTTVVSNAVFGVAAAIAGLSFSWARALPEGDERAAVLFAGERFLHAALTSGLASALKYAARALDTLQPEMVLSRLVMPIAPFVVGLLGATVIGLFMMAASFFQQGFAPLLRQLWARAGMRARDIV